MKKLFLLGTIIFMAFSLYAQEWVDLGLPSGTRWKSHNEGGYFENYDARDEFRYQEQLPTKKQFEELLTVCEWEPYNNGYKVIGPNGNFIKFPAAGWMNRDGHTLDMGKVGRYWTQDYDSNYRYWILEFWQSVTITSIGDRFGCSVRLVMSKNDYIHQYGEEEIELE